MDFYNSNRENKYGKRAGFLGHKSASKSNPSSPPHPTEAPPVTHFGIKRSESEYAFPVSDDHTTHWKQQQHASERVPNSGHRPPVYRHSTPDRPRENGKERGEDISYEPDADVTPRSNASMSPFRSSRTRTPDRRRRSTDFSRELYERMYEAQANVSPFHPSRSRSPAPYNMHDRERDYSRERYEAEGHMTSRKSAPSSPFHPSQSPSHTRTMPVRYQKGKDHFEGMYEADGEDVTPGSSPPMSPVHGATSRFPPPPFYSSSDEEDNHSTYLFPEIATGHRSRGVSGSNTPVHYKYQITATETYEQDMQFEPPELPDEAGSFTMQEITKMRGIDSSYKAGKEETQLVISEAYVSVASYKVRKSVSATLQTIMDKQGDIAASSKLQSSSTRSFYLESLATAVMELKSTALRDLTKARVAEIEAVVKDMDSVKIDISWLKTAVKELAEAVECFGLYDAAKMEKEECNRGMREGKVEMEELREELRRREKETKECRERVTEMAGRLGKLEMKDSKVTKSLELFQSKRVFQVCEMEMVSGKVVQGCPNAGNPFHECTAICLEILNSGNVHKKEKKLFGFGKRTPGRDTPSSSPARGSRSPLASYFAKKKVESDTSPSTDHTNGNFFSRLSPLQGRPSQLKNEPTNNMDSLPMSPSLAGYSGGDYFARRADQRGGEDNDMYSPRPFGTQPRTPEHPLRTPRRRPHTPKHRSDTSPWAHQEDPISLETRPRTPERVSNTSDTRPMTPVHDSSATARRPQTPENRMRTEQHRGRSPEFMARSPGPRSKTPEPQPTYFEPLSRTPKQRSKTPEPSPRIPQTHPISHRSLDSAAFQTPRAAETKPRIHESRQKTAVQKGKSPDRREKISQTSSEMGQRSSQAYNYLGSKAESVYIENDDESVLLYPELILSPQERPLSRPITPSRRGYETPTKQEERFDQLDESASSDDDRFSFVDDEHDDNSIWRYPETTPKSGRTTPVHHKSPSKQDEPQSFSLIIKENETREDVQSTQSESIVSVGDYKVRASVSATLEQILDKHGDIASASKLHSLATRSYYLDMLASVVFELQTTPLKHLKESRVVEMLAIVRDVESVKIKVDWLKPVLEEIVEAVKHYDQHMMSITEKEVWEGDVLLVRQEMEKQGKELREKEKKLREWRERTTEMAGKLGSLDMRKARLDKRLAVLSSKVDKFQGESLLQDIL
ncbi:unnamed protein product [Brassica rapa]|uniref:Phospholipase-like protein (PEARLI 4) family protein n=2 Tax=Brassica campestris TaxID=3711 RepID=A0A8D9LNU9_BRACM|nr:unnamed protein product [Brassica rapa]